MIIDCEVLLEREGVQTSFCNAALGIGKQINNYYMVLIGSTGPQLKRKISSSNCKILPKGFSFKSPHCFININKIYNDRMFELFKRAVQKIIKNKNIKLPDLSSIMKHKVLPKKAYIKEDKDFEEINGRYLQKIKIKNVELDSKINEIIEWNNLTELNIENCILKTIPYALTSLKQLRSLALIECKITTIPMWFCNEMQMLKNLSLDRNLIKNIPVELFHYIKLSGLYLSNNLIEIPNFLMFIPKDFPKPLIDVRYNNIKFIPNTKLVLQTARIDIINTISTNTFLFEFDVLQYTMNNKSLLNICMNTLVNKNFKAVFNSKIISDNIYDILQSVYLCYDCQKVIFNDFQCFITNLSDYRIVCKDCEKYYYHT